MRLLTTMRRGLNVIAPAGQQAVHSTEPGSEDASLGAGSDTRMHREMSRAWMPLYIGDFLKNTAHLSTCERGAYLLLLMYHWERGSLPGDDASLARMTGCHPPHWRRLKTVLMPFFDVQEDGSWTQKRLLLELSKMDEISNKNKEAALRSHSARKANALRSHSYSQSHSHKKENLPSAGRQAVVWIEKDDPRWKALAERHESERGKSPPTDRNFGWHFPAEWLANGAENS